jgi:hypothetical protein
MANARSTEVLRQNADFIRATNNIVPIACEDDLLAVPVVMQIPILTHPRVRQLFEDGRIEGWGLDPRQLPEEDVVGRLIDNGKCGDEINDQGQWEFKSDMHWSWYDDDPDHSQEELKLLDVSRQFVQDYIDRQLSPEGELKDPTGALYGSLIRPKKKK